MWNIKDISGNRYGMLVVLKDSKLRSNDGSVIWDCICDCGESARANSGNLKSGTVKSCGCLIRHNLINKVFGRLTVIADSGERSPSRTIIWLCKCNCGNEKKVESSLLIKNQTRSCGCLQIESRFTHNQTNTPEYGVWVAMKDRCSNTNNENYTRYGGRSISVCDRWSNSFENFYADMGQRPSDDHSIDRINNDGHYEPGNCKWSTRIEQANNRRDNLIVTYKNKQFTVAQLAREYQLNDLLIYNRLLKGWTIEAAVETPVR